MILSNHLILSHPLLLLPSIFPSIRVYSNESAVCIRCPKYWSFSFSISPYNEYSEFILHKIDWFDPLAVQGTLESLLQYHSLKASILQHSAFFMVQLSHLYMTVHICRKTITLTIWTFVSKAMFLFFNTLSKQDIYPKAAEYVFLSNAQKAFSRIDHILGCKSSLGTCKKTEIISNIFSQTQHYGIRSKLQGEKSLK